MGLDKIRKVIDFIRAIPVGLSNFWKFKRVIWSYRWWDFGYFLDITDFILEDWSHHYGRSSHFMGDKTVGLRARVLRKYLQEYENSITVEDEDEHWDKFCRMFCKNLRRFWD